MKKIRIGNDIFVTWTILDADGEPYDLTGKDIDVRLVVNTKSGQRIIELNEREIEVSDFEIEDNKIKFYFYGKDQSFIGIYTAKFIENNEELGMVTFDLNNAFEIVPHSWLEGQGDTTTIETEVVELESEIDNTIMAELQRKADKVVNAVAGHIAILDSEGNLVDSGIDISQIARWLNE